MIRVAGQRPLAQVRPTGEEGSKSEAAEAFDLLVGAGPKTRGRGRPGKADDRTRASRAEPPTVLLAQHTLSVAVPPREAMLRHLAEAGLGRPDLRGQGSGALAQFQGIADGGDLRRAVPGTSKGPSEVVDRAARPEAGLEPAEPSRVGVAAKRDAVDQAADRFGSVYGQPRSTKASEGREGVAETSSSREAKAEPTRLDGFEAANVERRSAFKAAIEQAASRPIAPPAPSPLTVAVQDEATACAAPAPVHASQIAAASGARNEDDLVDADTAPAAVGSRDAGLGEPAGSAAEPLTTLAGPVLPATPEPTTPNAEHLQEIVRQVETVMVEGGTLGRDLKLNLGELGLVRVRIASTTAGLTVAIAADDTSARVALSSSRAELEASLGDRGFAGSRVEVQAATGAHEESRGGLGGNTPDGRERGRSQADAETDADAQDAHVAAVRRREYEKSNAFRRFGAA